LLAPDLLRNYSKDTYNKKKVSHSILTLNKLLNSQNGSIHLKDFFLGMDTHIQRDKSFHESIFFNSVYNDTHPIIEEAFNKALIPRFWFALHVLIEMQLDQFLIQSNPKTLDLFYSELNQLNAQMLEDFLHSIDHQDPLKFKSGFQRFLDSQFLIKYTEHHGIIYGLNRIYHQVGIQTQEWNANQYAILFPVLENIASSIKKHVKYIQPI
jgi:hypothetical protein